MHTHSLPTVSLTTDSRTTQNVLKWEEIFANRHASCMSVCVFLLYSNKYDVRGERANSSQYTNDWMNIICAICHNLKCKCCLAYLHYTHRKSNVNTFEYIWIKQLVFSSHDMCVCAFLCLNHLLHGDSVYISSVFFLFDNIVHREYFHTNVIQLHREKEREIERKK